MTVVFTAQLHYLAKEFGGNVTIISTLKMRNTVFINREYFLGEESLAWLNREGAFNSIQ